ncbi:hypothetical protein ZOSMA_202G00130 [Zostera marina]|uniref:Myb-like domain-containing protein n=1 Tax=Zostera marina TaxID=29655 RepID=A0A0K9PLR7_ZOSMR|nr:hypothetical protein ZOSMA_202G00130 [Zostera marina]
MTLVIGENMEADPNLNFHMGMLSSQLHGSHVVSFQSGTITNSSMVYPMEGSSETSFTPGMMLAGNQLGQSGSCSSNLFFDQMAGLSNNAALPVDWSYDEQLLLETGFLNYAHELNITKYIKIAALLRNKTVRDVALRCRWMCNKGSGKRRKPKEHYPVKKMKDRKDKSIDSSLISNKSPYQQENMPFYSFMTPHMNNTSRFLSEVPIIDDATQCLIEENNLIFHQLEDNLENVKLQNNFSLFCHSRNNITSILSRMGEMPGIMSQMPPLPIEINKELADAVLPSLNEQMMFGMR